MLCLKFAHVRDIAILESKVAIERQKARDLDPDSDLGDLLVTTKVGVLPTSVVTEALDRGAAEAKRRHLTAALSLKGDWRLLEAA